MTGRSHAARSVHPFRIDLSYDGSGFHGWARQGDLRTVQGVLEVALERALREPVKLTVAGRTDAGVHARGQVASFEGSVVDTVALARALNGMVGPEVSVRSVRRAPDGFNARFSATAREYRYRIRTALDPDPFGHPYSWYLPGPLDVRAMRSAASSLVGEHDFAAFCRRPPTGTTVRRLERLTVVPVQDGIEIGARANAFLHQMVRSLVRMLVEVGRGRVRPEAVAGVLASRDRSRTPGPAPAHGLTLERVVYRRRPLTAERSRR